MSNASTSAEKRIIEQCNAGMYGFGYHRRKEWIIWSAIKRVCPTCSAPVGAPCMNMADRKARRPERVNGNPHEDRIDWPKIFDGLKQRGYLVA